MKLNIPVLTDDDEWNNYHSVKKDPVLHVDVASLGDILLCSCENAQTY